MKYEYGLSLVEKERQPAVANNGCQYKTITMIDLGFIVVTESR